MGGTVNLASRLEGVNKLYGTSALVSAATAQQAEGAIELREIDLVEIAGIAEPERVFEVLGRTGEVDAATLELRDRFSEGLAAYRARGLDPGPRGIRGLPGAAPRRWPGEDLLAAARNLGLGSHGSCFRTSVDLLSAAVAPIPCRRYVPAAFWRDGRVV